MKSGKHLAVSLCGAIGLVITILVIVCVNHLTGFNLFSFTLYAIVPVGGLIAGFAAASGYYFSSIRFGLTPNKPVLLQIVLASALAQILIYYAEFRLMRFEDGTAVSTVMSFLDYLKAYLQTLHIYGGRGLRDLGTMAGSGWWFAGIEYLGFLLGGLAAYLALLAHPVCRSCACYLEKVGSRHQIFSQPQSFSLHYQTLPHVVANAEAFTSLLALVPPNEQKGLGDIKLVTCLHCCPHCKGERIEQQVKVLTAKGWRNSAEHARQFDVPASVGLSDCFNELASDREVSNTTGRCERRPG